MAEILLNEGADINAVNGKGEVPLHCAIISGRPKKVEFLLKHGADHNRWWSNSLGSALNLDNDWSVGCDGSATCSATHHPDELTLFNSAIKLGKVEVVEYLIYYLGFEEVERPNRIDKHDAVKTLLFYALPSVEIVEILLDSLVTTKEVDDNCLNPADNRK
ncbi:ankyrin repeat domain-containing protein 35-like [Trichogramma pretiosum]|uniref:ankyrin repeat domain-containing protein 35-like n=1 Tax=Trichogramma pretiosum TaxID=7493 RepID=UPI000C71982D|nr:ankyrin repeat domain-containing protein 35-like [Trichogramma pretiosum]